MPIYDAVDMSILPEEYLPDDYDGETAGSIDNIAGEYNMSRVVRKPAFCICENKDADQLRGNREADPRLCFRYKDSTIPLLPISEISSL